MKTGFMVPGLLAGIFFGLATPFSKVLLSSTGPFIMAGLLYAGAALACVPYVAVHFSMETASLKHSGKIKYLAGIAFFGGVLGPLLLMCGLKISCSSSVSVWLNLELAATALLGRFFFKENFDFRTASGILLTLAAGVIISFQEDTVSVYGALFTAAACLCWGLDNHLTAIADAASPQTITFIKGISAGIFNLTAGILMADRLPSAGTVIPALVIGVFSYGISSVLYVISAQKIGASRSQILFATAPFWGILCAFIWPGETPHAKIFAAMGILAAGIFCIHRPKHSHFHRHSAVTHTHVHSHDDGHHSHTHTEGELSMHPHIHEHAHKQVVHSHPHYPDLHHRHEHSDWDEKQDR